MQKCKFCQRDYDIKETKRIFGDVWWAGIYCTAQCYTKSMFITDITEVSMKIEKGPDLRITMTDDDGGSISTQSVEANILYEMLQELKQIKRHLTSRTDQMPQDDSQDDSQDGAIAI